MALFLAVLSGCVTSAFWGNEFTQTAESDEYTLKITYGGIVPPQIYSDEAVDEKTRPKIESEAQKYLAARPQYSEYEILSFERDRVLSSMTYTVKFK